MLCHGEEVPSLLNTLGIAAHGGLLKNTLVKVEAGCLATPQLPRLVVTKLRMAPDQKRSSAQGEHKHEIRFSIDRGGTFTDVFAEVRTALPVGMPKCRNRALSGHRQIALSSWTFTPQAG